MSIKIKRCFDKIVDHQNLYLSAQQTTLKGLRFKPHGARWKWKLESHLLSLREELISGKYRHGKYQSFTIYDPKQRSILAAQMKDRVVHHAINNVIEPIVDRKFISDSYACRKYKGQHLAMKEARRHVQASPYFIHLDVRKFFYNIHRNTLFEIIARTIKDERALDLIQEILKSSIRHAHFTPQPPATFDLFNQTPQEDYNLSGYPNEERGIPIGNLCSQLFANWYMHELDAFIKHKLKQRRYVRYMDDLVLFDSCKKRLQQCESEIQDFALSNLRLQLHASGGASPCSKGLTFLGFKIYRTHIKMKSESVKRFRKKLTVHLKNANLQSADSFFDVFRRVQAWNAHASHADSYGLRKSMFSKHPWTALMFEANFDEPTLKTLWYDRNC